MLRTTEREREWKTMKLKWMKKEGVRKRDSFLLPFLWRRKNGFLKAARISISFFISTTIFFTTICTNIFLVYLGAQCSYTECDSIETQIEGGGRWVGKEDFNHYHQHRSQRLDHSFHCISLRHLTLPLLYTGSHIFSLLLIYFIIPLLLFLNDLCCSDTHRESVCVFAFICVVKRFLTRSGHNDSKSIILFTFPFYLQHLCVYFFSVAEFQMVYVFEFSSLASFLSHTAVVVYVCQCVPFYIS